MNIFKDKEANKFLEILKNDWINQIIIPIMILHI